MSQHDRDALLARLDEDISVAEQLEPAEWRLICGLAEPLAKLDETTRPHVMLGHIERGSAHWQRQLGRFYVGVYEPLLALQAFDRAVALDRDDCGALADAANLLSVLN